MLLLASNHRIARRVSAALLAGATGDSVAASLERLRGMHAALRAALEADTRADRGYVTLLFEVFSQKRERVMSYSCVEIVKRRAG